MSDWDHFRHFMASVVGWFTTSANWTGSSGIPYLFLRQAELSLAVVLGALVVGGGIGLVLGHTGRGGLVRAIRGEGVDGCDATAQLGFTAPLGAGVSAPSFCGHCINLSP